MEYFNGAGVQIERGTGNTVSEAAMLHLVRRHSDYLRQQRP